MMSSARLSGFTLRQGGEVIGAKENKLPDGTRSPRYFVTQRDSRFYYAIGDAGERPCIFRSIPTTTSKATTNAGQIEAGVNATLSRLSDQITRVEIHLSDENAGKSGSADKRCLMEARPAGRQPIAVSHEGSTLEEAYSGAAKKLRSLLENTFGRARDHKGGASIRTDGAM